MWLSKMRCWLCGKQVPRNDPMYPYVHYECSNKFLGEMENLRVIDILSIEGTQIEYKFNESFERHLNKTLDDTRFHIIADETVDEDLVTMQGVLKAVLKYLQKGIPYQKIYRCAELVFNSLMMRKYGHPLSKEKKFFSRVKEFAEEVYTIPTDEATAKFFRALRKSRWAA